MPIVTESTNSNLLSQWHPSSKRKVYAGVGSRETPRHILEVIYEVAGVLKEAGWVCRTGGADGADDAFLAGGTPQVELLLPWAGFNGHPGSMAKIP